ncbi:hypothetical protein VSR01_22900 [Actinacidiphila sp. DG2A-62]|uniref:hypothetical protein n=1 Tax=Actinacidiphila sp. DG2A-62 TaxID=3108821 RepID=UPI002DBB58F8|nr:hypothetical protein [Actinacidiphila sp. DG2A-62]MEC3996211.1 hypothetical protein [Actinacidiphila sp. DG2A-62]
MTADALPNNVIRGVREVQFRMSREEFARLVNTTAAATGENTGCTARLVAAWERGEVTSPRPVYERVLHELTGRGLAELGFRPRRTATETAVRLPQLAHPNDPYTRKADDTDVERRALLRDGVGSVTSVALGLNGPQSSGRRMGMREVRSVVASTMALYAHDHDHGSAVMRREATKALHTSYEWLNHGHFTQATGRLLRSATGALSIAAGWLSFDSGQHADARSLYNEALAAARLAQDPELEAHSFGCLSLLAKASGRPREAVAAAQAARSVAGPLGSPRMHALFAMREAGGWALIGDRSACDAAIIDAHAYYAKGPRENDPAWLEFFTPAELAGLEALCRADLGQHERAAYGAEQAVLLHGEAFARNRALYVADIAVQNAVRDRPDLDAAVDAANKVLTFVPEVKSRRLLNALREVEAALQRHAKAPLASEWLDKHRALTIDSA